MQWFSIHHGATVPAKRPTGQAVMANHAQTFAIAIVGAGTVDKITHYATLYGVIIDTGV